MQMSHVFTFNCPIGCCLGMALGMATAACTFTGANEDGGKRIRGQDGYGVNISGTRFGTKSWNLSWSPNGSRTNITTWNLDRSARNFSARLFHFQKNTKSDLFRARTRKKEKKRPCEERTTTDPVNFWIKNIKISNPEHSKSNPRLPILGKSRNRKLNAICFYQLQ